MRTIEEQDAGIAADDSFIDRPNGFMCPDCGEETVDINILETLKATDDSPIPQREIRCPCCGWEGTRNI